MDKPKEKYHIDFEELVLRAIQHPTLRKELIDHGCSSIEELLQRGFSPDEALQMTLDEIAPNGLEHIEKQVQFILTPQIPFTMKMTQYFFGFMATMLILSGFTFKAFHWPMASIILFMGFVSLATSMSALLFAAVRFSQRYSHRACTLSGAAGGFILSIGSIFKLMHWPGANILSLLGMLLIILVFVPLFFWRLYKMDQSHLQHAE